MLRGNEASRNDWLTGGRVAANPCIATVKQRLTKIKISLTLEARRLMKALYKLVVSTSP